MADRQGSRFQRRAVDFQTPAGGLDPVALPVEKLGQRNALPAQREHRAFIASGDFQPDGGATLRADPAAAERELAKFHHSPEQEVAAGGSNQRKKQSLPSADNPLQSRDGE